MAEIPIDELFARIGLDLDEQSFGLLDAVLAGARGGLIALGAIATGVGLAIAGAAKSTADAADSIDELAQRTGVNAKALQELGFAASFSGVSLDELAQSLNFMAKKGVKDVQGEFLRLADQMAALPEEGGARAAFAMEHFGRSGARLVPVLGAGRKGLEEWIAKARDLNVVMSDELVAAGVDFSDTLQLVQYALTGIRNTVGEAALPALTAMLKGMLEWIRVNREVIATRITAFINGVAIAFRTLAAVLSPFITALSFVIDHFKFFAVVMGSVVLAALMANIAHVLTATALYAGMSTAAVTAALSAAAAWIAAAAPFAALAGLIAIVLLMIDEVWTSIRGGKTLFGELTKSWDPQLTAAADAWWEFKNRVTKIWDELAAKWKEIVSKIDPRAIIMGELRTEAESDAIGSGISRLLYNAFGGGASPQASATTSPTVGAGRTTVFAPSIKSEVNVQPGPGMDSRDLAEHIVDVQSEEWRKMLTEAEPSVAGGTGMWR